MDTHVETSAKRAKSGDNLLAVFERKTLKPRRHSIQIQAAFARNVLAHTIASVRRMRYRSYVRSLGVLLLFIQ